MAAETIDRIVAAALDAEVRSCRRPREGSIAETAVLELDSEPNEAVCKLGGASVWTGDVIEPLVVERVGEETDLPVPDVLATGSLADGELDRSIERWALYERLSGTNPKSEYADLEPAARRRLIADAGESLGRLHATSALSFDRVGGLRRDDGAEQIGGCLELCDPDGWHAIDPGVGGKAIPVPLAGDADCRPVLTHGDYHPGNVLVGSNGKITAILDWGNAHVTHSEYALARAEARFVDVYASRLRRKERARLRRIFRRAYAVGGELENGFDRRAPVYKLLWALQSGANYAQIARSARGRRQLWRQCRRTLER
ncbi:phosphotransferase family protein [Natrialbaceae archaeon A-arb3/5]